MSLACYCFDDLTDSNLYASTAHSPKGHPLAKCILIIAGLLMVIHLLGQRFPRIERFIPLYSYLCGPTNRKISLLSHFDSVMKQSSIPYSIAGYLLHAAISRKSLPAGDFRMMVVIRQEDVAAFLDTHLLFKNLGLSIQDLPGGTFLVTSAMSLPFLRNVALEVIPVQWTGDRWISTGPHVSESGFPAKLFSSRVYQLDSLMLPGPALDATQPSTLSLPPNRKIMRLSNGGILSAPVTQTRFWVA